MDETLHTPPSPIFGNVAANPVMNRDVAPPNPALSTSRNAVASSPTIGRVVTSPHPALSTSRNAVANKTPVTDHNKPTTRRNVVRNSSPPHDEASPESAMEDYDYTPAPLKEGAILSTRPFVGYPDYNRHPDFVQPGMYIVLVGVPYLSALRRNPGSV